MEQCTFCGSDIEPGTGKMFIKKDGNIRRFCSSKCEKNALKLKRSGRTSKWTKTAHDVKEGVQN